MSSTVIKKSIALSVDVSVNVHSGETTSTNQRGGRNRPSRKRRQLVKTQYSYSDSDISEDDARREEAVTTKLPKTTTSTTKARPNNNNNYHQRSSYNNNRRNRTRNMECQKRQERQLMRHWLVDQVNQGDIPGLEWLNNNSSNNRATDKTLIKIPWTHASRHGWDVARDSDLFRRWAIHTGKYSSDPKDANEDGNPKKWKANFRCAMNSLPDISEMKSLSQKKGNDAYKVYKLMEEKPRGQCRKKSRPNSESSDSDQHYNKYVTKADRLERHKSVKERVRQAIHDKQHMVKLEKEPALPVFDDNMNHQYGNRGGEIPLAVSIATTTAAMTTTRIHQQHHQQQFHNNGYHVQPYMSSDSDGGNSPIKRPRTLPVDAQDLRLATRKPPYMMTQSVEKEVEISTSITEMDFFNGVQRHEHSYAVNMMTDRTIPSLVADFETEPDSDYGSTSPSSSQGTMRENQEERIAQCISDMENEYPNPSNMFSPSTPNMNQEPMFCSTYNPSAHADPRNNIYKRSESMELYPVPGTVFDQSFPMTGDMSTGTPMQMDNEPAMDRSLQFSEI